MESTAAVTMTALDATLVAVSAGRYFVGDPCYPFPNNGPDDGQWHRLLDTCDYFQGAPVGTVTVKGQTFPVLGFSTAYGDGGYPGTDGVTYSVDSGTLGLVPMALVEAFVRETDDEWLSRLGSIVEFPEGFIAKREGEGKITLGSIVIETGDSDEVEACHRCGYDMEYGYCERSGCVDNDEDDDEFE
jgi:hypothetical protein